MEFLTKSFSTISNFFQTLSAGRKLAFVTLLTGLVIGIAAIFYWASRTSYSTLLTATSPADATSVIRYLREKRIPFIVDETGKQISVPPEKVYDVRLELASSGLAQTDVVGYEIWDKQTFGATSTQQEVTKQRSTEGELVRTINHIRGIERSRVHLAIPKKSAFLEESRRPTASVILDLAPGFNPSEDQVKGIQRLVSSAVEGLETNSVTIVSNSGKQLSQNNDDPAAAFAAATLDYQRKYERKLEEKVITLLSTVAGEGKVKAQIAADFDFSREARTETLFDDELKAVKSTSRDRDMMEGNRPLPGGQAGVKSQTPGVENQLANNPSATNKTDRNNEVTTYEVPKTVKSSEKPMATLKRISVSVMVDAEQVADDKAPGGFRAAEVPPAMLDKYKALVANAVGWEQGRDPAIEIKSIPFFREDLEGATKAALAVERNRLLMNLGQWAAVGLIFTLFFLFVVRPFIKWVTENTVESVEDFLPQTLEELEKVQSRQVAQSLEDILPEIEEKVDPEKVQSEMLKEKVVSLVNDNPNKASQILHEWIAEKPADNKDKDKTA
ncbi:MAG TPA: flagellar basal-body MS-ring/collar protein FliF [Bdellovibrionota bacterium]